MLFLGGVLVACAIEHRRLHRRIAITVLKLVGSDPKMLILGFMLPTWFLSMWMSNTATTAMMVTIVEAVLVSLNSDEENVEQNAVTDRKTPSKHSSSRFIKNTHNPNGNVYSAENQMTLEPASIISVDLSETADEPQENKLKTNELTGSMADSMETVRKLNKALSFLFGSDTGLTFSTWMAFALPISIILLLLVWGWLTIRYFGLRSCFRKSKNENQCEFIEKLIAREADSLGTFNYAEGMCCVLFALITTLWITRNVGEFGWGKYFRHPSGQTFVTDTQPAILVALLALILPAVNPVQLYRRQSDNRGDATEFTSNAATVSILLPIIFSLGSSLGLHPFLLALPTTVGTSFAFSLPAATPPNSIVFGKGRISVKDMVRSGIPLNILGCLITLAATVTYAQPLFGLDKLPEWAINGTLASFSN
ncbi:hypothetical protein AHF37_06561 [Paragonimus kellicotti]|nr:hypothetical protein AHF37_06561 [Paragonimus kellicotti]